MAVDASMSRMPNDHNPPGGISTRLVSLPAIPADLPVTSGYDSFAEAYAAETEANLINGYYTRPAMLALAGDVAGRRISTLAAARVRCPRRCATGAPW